LPLAKDRWRSAGAKYIEGGGVDMPVRPVPGSGQTSLRPKRHITQNDADLLKTALEASRDQKACRAPGLFFLRNRSKIKKAQDLGHGLGAIGDLNSHR